MGAVREQVRYIAHGFVASRGRSVEEEVAGSGGGAGEVAGDVLVDHGPVALQRQKGGDHGGDEVGDSAGAEAVGVDGVPLRGHVAVECDPSWSLHGGWRWVEGGALCNHRE